MPPSLTVRRDGDPGEDRLVPHLSEFAWDRVTQVEPASGIEGGTGNQNLRAAAGPRWCVPCTLVAQTAPSLVVGERFAESSMFEYGRRIRDGEQERARRGSLPPTGASPGRYIGTFDNDRFGWSLPWDAALSELWKGPGEEGGAGGHTRHAEGGCGRPCFERWVLGEEGGGTTTQGQKEREGLLVPRQ